MSIPNQSRPPSPNTHNNGAFSVNSGHHLMLPPFFVGCFAFRNMRRSEPVRSFRRVYVNEDIEGKMKQERPKHTNQWDKNVGTFQGAHRGPIVPKG